MKLGKLDFVPFEGRLELVAESVKNCLELNKIKGVLVSEIDPSLADTAAFCEKYDISPGISANCVVVEARRSDKTWYAACLILATTRADVNGIIRKHLGARKISFASMDNAVSLTGMEYGGINPIGVPDDWQILVDSGVAKEKYVLIGSGIRKSKLVVPSDLFKSLPNTTIMKIVQ